jgi:hypothetical protein
VALGSGKTVLVTEVHTLLGLRSLPVAPHGDCYALAAMSGHELTTDQAAHPDADAKEKILSTRGGAVDIVAGDADIGGVCAQTVREEEQMPTDSVTKLDAWRQAGKWATDEPQLAVAFMFAHAAHLGRPTIVLELTPDKLSYRATARLYGM